MLVNDVPDNKITFSRSRCAYDQQSAERVNEIDPAVPLLPFQIIYSRQVYRIFIVQQTFFLWKCFIIRIEDILV